jgi:hypothetical protein
MSQDNEPIIVTVDYGSITYIMTSDRACQCDEYCHASLHVQKMRGNNNWQRRPDIMQILAY